MADMPRRCHNPEPRQSAVPRRCWADPLAPTNCHGHAAASSQPAKRLPLGAVPGLKVWQQLVSGHPRGELFYRNLCFVVTTQVVFGVSSCCGLDVREDGVIKVTAVFPLASRFVCPSRSCPRCRRFLPIPRWSNCLGSWRNAMRSSRRYCPGWRLWKPKWGSILATRRGHRLQMVTPSCVLRLEPSRKQPGASRVNSPVPLVSICAKSTNPIRSSPTYRMAAVGVGRR